MKLYYDHQFIDFAVITQSRNVSITRYVIEPQIQSINITIQRYVTIQNGATTSPVLISLDAFLPVWLC